MIGLLIVAGVIGLITFAIYKSSKKCAQYYGERKLKHVGLLEGLPNIYKLIFRKVDMLQLSKELYTRFPDEA